MEPGFIELLKAIGPVGIFAYLVITAYLKHQNGKKANGEDPTGGGMLNQLFFQNMVDHLEKNTEALTRCADGLKKVLEHQEEERPLLDEIKNQLERFEH